MAERSRRRGHKIVQPIVSSDTESDSGLEYEAPAPAPRKYRDLGNGQANANEKKKKKKKLAPQESIDKIWTKFSSERFSKALTVLPFSPVALPSAPSRGNEPFSAGYERAAEECRRKVRKIIQECKRVNTRYRDPGWDLDWDFKAEKGHCLNSLGKSKFPLTHSAMISASATVPKAVKRVHEIFEKPTFMEKIDASEIKQGALGDCWFMAGLSGLANVEDGLKRVCVEYDTRIGIYGFVFFRDGEWIYSIIDDKLYLKSPCWDSPSLQRDLLSQIDREDVERVYRQTYQTGSKALFFAQNRDQNETWVPLLEKAYAKAHGDYSALAGGWIGECLEDVSGGVTTELFTSDILDTEAFWEDELSKINKEFLFGCSTGLMEYGYGKREGITEGHAYNVLETRTLKNGTRLVKLRNPWGKVKKGTWEGAWSDGSKEWTVEIQEEVGHTFGSDSTFWISYEDLLRKYTHFDRTRLFRESDWRYCQRWIGVEVPWRPVYNEKFHIKLTKDSPLVLVMSQLDTRYFKGLQGQYSFRLQFRVHEQSAPGAEDYIVRSHGNYLMDRSVGVEIPSMAAGNYTVFLSVIAERDPNASSVEAVVKKESKKRIENEKLAQVGHAYDLAHSKASAHLAEVAKIRKQADREVAREARTSERRKLWEKRHLGRHLDTRQRHKNADKKAAKLKRREEAAQKVADELAALDRADQEAAEREAAAKAAAEAVAKAAEAEKLRQEKEAAELEKRIQQEAADIEKRKQEEAESSDKTAEAASSTNVSEEPEAPQLQDAPEVVEAGKENTEDATKQENESASTSGSSTPILTPAATPACEDAPRVATEGAEAEKVAVPPMETQPEVSGAPPQPAVTPTPPEAPRPVPQVPKRKAPAVRYISDEDSSDSPLSDYEEMYSEDDMSKESRMPVRPPPPPVPEEDDTEDELDPLPWNAICVVGFRVFSKDENLELRVVMEGGALEQGGMGDLGEQDLDNAQANAGGERVDPKEESKDAEIVMEAQKDDKQADEKTAEEVKKDDAPDGDKEEKKDPGYFSSYQHMIRKDDKEFDRARAPVESEDEAAITALTAAADAGSLNWG